MKEILFNYRCGAQFIHLLRPMQPSCYLYAVFESCYYSNHAVTTLEVGRMFKQVHSLNWHSPLCRISVPLRNMNRVPGMQLSQAYRHGALTTAHTYARIMLGSSKAGKTIQCWVNARTMQWWPMCKEGFHASLAQRCKMHFLEICPASHPFLKSSVSFYGLWDVKNIKRWYCLKIMLKNECKIRKP